MGKILLFIIMLVVINSVFSLASIDITYSCENRNCLEGTPVNFTVAIGNNINKTISIDNIKVVETNTRQILALNLMKEEILESGERGEYLIQTLVAKPINETYTYYFVPCFSAKIFDEGGGISEQGEVCGEIEKSMPILPLGKVWCETDDECNWNEYCNTFSLYKCVTLECAEGETSWNHTCIPDQDATSGATGAAITIPESRNILILAMFGVGVILILIGVSIMLKPGKGKPKKAGSNPAKKK